LTLCERIKNNNEDCLIALEEAWEEASTAPYDTFVVINTDNKFLIKTKDCITDEDVILHIQKPWSFNDMGFDDNQIQSQFEIEKYIDNKKNSDFFDNLLDEILSGIKE
jgi:hypothetical protein